MFGFAGRRKRKSVDAAFDVLDSQSVKALGSVAQVLVAQLLLCRSRPGYTAGLQSKFVRGYLFGFFDAALQRLGLLHKSEEEAILRIIVGHSLLFSDQNIDAFDYVLGSVHLQDDPIYKAAHQKGVDELFECFGTEARRPQGLTTYFFTGID